MKFYKLNEVPTQNDDRVFKASPVIAGISFAVASAITITLLFCGIHGVAGIDVPRFIYYVAVAFAALFSWLTFHSFRASLQPSNWLLRCNDCGVIIHFRSYLNWRFPAGSVEAVGFNYSEIAWAKTVKERRDSPGLGSDTSKQTQRLTFLDLCLTRIDTAALEAQLSAENSLSPEGIMISRTYPVQVLPGGIVEIRWSGIYPSARKAIQCLSQHVKIAGADSRKVDLTHQANLPPGTEDGKILALAKSGDEMGAMQLTRQIYGHSLSEAKDFVDKLRSGTR